MVTQLLPSQLTRTRSDPDTGALTIIFVFRSVRLSKYQRFAIDYVGDRSQDEVSVLE